MKKRSLFFLITILLCTACDKSHRPAEESKAVLTNGIDSLSYAVGMRYSAQRQELAATLENFGSDSTFIDKLLEGLRDGILSEDNKELQAYYLGLESGIQMRKQIVEVIEEEIFADDSTQRLNVQNVLAGFHDYMNGKTTFHTGHQELVQKDLRLYIQDKMKEEQLKVASQRYADLRKKNEDFFATKLQEEGVQEIDGILYKEIKSGKGPRPTDGNMAEVEYQGYLMDSTLFDQTYAPTVFPVSCEVKGLNIALKNMQPGAEWEIYIPWNLGYGSKGRGTSMPPFSTLTYRLKLINFK